MRRCTEGRKKMKSATEGLAEAAGKRVDIEDRINQLADDILISIISRLCLRESTTTSILSSCWRYLYAYSSYLDFPPFKPESSPTFRECVEEIQEKRFPHYINTVNPILDSHKGITYAANLQSIEICNMMNLVSLRCYGLPSTYVLRISNVPKLIEFDTSDQRDNTLEQVLPRIPSCILDQLRLLKLSTQTIFIQYTSPTYMLPELVNLKHLELKVHMWRLTDNNDALFPLVEACPSLEELDIKVLLVGVLYSIEFEDREIYNFRPMKKLSPNLKKLKLLGYLGSPSELEFALFILKHVDALQELIVQPNSDMSKKIQRRAEARARMHFRRRVRKSVKLVII
ncbi:hypothetical protein DH2020_001944 [Rehmannia glutinosa]|uniref:At1g61320/AtMIF1 LRR domain-containing protein n=1 Tax=Rehmannia glutinosa TaxID=99300 RepID=A0ABR0XSR2_REHGL